MFRRMFSIAATEILLLVSEFPVWSPFSYTNRNVFFSVWTSLMDKRSSNKWKGRGGGVREGSLERFTFTSPSRVRNYDVSVFHALRLCLIASPYILIQLYRAKRKKRERASALPRLAIHLPASSPSFAVCVHLVSEFARCRSKYTPPA